MTDSDAEPETSDSLKAFGEVIKAFRKRAGLTQEQYAPRVGYSVETVSSVEQGRRFPSPKFVDRSEEFFDAFGAIKGAAKHLSREPGLANWFRRWAEKEAKALCLYTYENRLIPGLLQIEAYQRILFEGQLPPMGDAEIEENLVARMKRQKLLTERVNTAYSFIIEEHVLRRETGGPEVHKAQIEHILRMSERRNIEVQVMEQSRGHHAGLDGAMRLLETPENRWYAYSEGQESGVLISDAKVVGILQMRYARMRSQALTLEDSQSLLRQMRGAT
ncbi:helix-turn-helix transcriptional regulator [Streptomyces sp. SKN60]|uniref:helix-turn-helix domain-containing protein n=1 Tax=Streptomyces sp. SKN60 TaxID=2855506 RepID=UPI00224560CD|nr:helix-turn-helix transcriptional regulator [Streptomyces sp. SKN60]MCX2184799.1 helix-turn-helix transcriptional regulator [Streptomyces sp. SKN60]